MFPEPYHRRIHHPDGPACNRDHDANGKLLFRKEQVEGRIEAGRDFAPGMYLVEVTNQTATKGGARDQIRTISSS